MHYLIPRKLENMHLRGIHVISIILFGLILSCEQKEEHTNWLATSYKVSGYVLDENNQHFPRVGVSINDTIHTLTDEHGYFIFKHIPEGIHQLKAIFIDTNYAFSIHTSEIDVKNGDLENYRVQLPNIIELQDPSLVSLDSINLNWSKSNADNFEEYRLFTDVVCRDSGQTIDQQKLLFKSIDENLHWYMVTKENYRNEYGKTLYPNGSFSFRVYAYDEEGIVSGSNIVQVNLPYWDTARFFPKIKLERTHKLLNENSGVAGIDWDTDGNLWMACNENVAIRDGSYQWHSLLVKYNFADKHFSDTINIDYSGYNEYPLASDGDWIWVLDGKRSSILKAYSKQSGKKVDSLYIWTNGYSWVTDVAKYDETFVVLESDHTYKIVPKQGNNVLSASTPFHLYGQASNDIGIARRNNTFWVMNSLYEIAVIGIEGDLQNIIKTELYRPVGYSNAYLGTNYNLPNKGTQTIPPIEHNGKMAVHNNKLAVITYFGVYIYDIVED